MSTKGERWILPEEILSGIWSRLEARTGGHTVLELYEDLEVFIKSDSLIKKHKLSGFSLKSQRSLERALDTDGAINGVFVKYTQNRKRVPANHLLNVLCLYAFGKNWENTLKRLDKTEDDIRRVYGDDEDERSVFISNIQAKSNLDIVNDGKEIVVPKFFWARKKPILILSLIVGGIAIFSFIAFRFNDNLKTRNNSNNVRDTTRWVPRTIKLKNIINLGNHNELIHEFGSTLYKFNGFVRRPSSPFSMVGAKYRDTSTIYSLENGFIFSGNKLSKDTHNHENAAILTEVDYVDGLTKRFGDLNRFPAYCHFHFKGDSTGAYQSPLWDSVFLDYKAKTIKGIIISGFGDTSDAHFQLAINRYVTLQRNLHNRGININQSYFRYGKGDETDIFIVRTYW